MKRQIQLISIIRHAVLGSFLAALIFSLSASSVRAAEFSPDVPHPAVARIMSVETNAASFGSGTLVYKQGKHALLITNHHVIKDSKEEILISFPNGFRSSGKVVASDPTWDLAALLIWSPGIKAVQITKQPPQPGDKLTIAGYGSGRYRAVSGICSQYVSPGLSQPHEMVELKAVARQGDSGGPIFNQQGELAGVLFGAGWRTTAGSYSGRVKKFLDPIVGRMQKATVEKQKVATAKPESTKPDTLLDPPQSQATITGFSVDTPPVHEPNQGKPGNTPASAQAIPVEDEMATTDSESPIAGITPVPQTTVEPTTIDNAVVSQDGTSVDPEPTSEPAEGEAMLVDESYFASKKEEKTVAAIAVPEQDQDPAEEIKDAGNQTSQPQSDEEIESTNQNENQSIREPLSPMLDLPESIDSTSSSSGASQIYAGEETDRSEQAKKEIDLSPKSSGSSQAVIGWEQLAGETLLQQIRTILAGIGFLAIVLQLARR